jgi:hypothetical protein
MFDVPAGKTAGIFHLQRDMFNFHGMGSGTTPPVTFAL